MGEVKLYLITSKLYLYETFRRVSVAVTIQILSAVHKMWVHLSEVICSHPLHSTPVSAVTLSILRPTPVIPRAAAVGAAMQKDNKTSCRHSNTSPYITTHTQHLHLAITTTQHPHLKPQTCLSQLSTNSGWTLRILSSVQICIPINQNTFPIHFTYLNIN